jgi:hypothetical protein
MWGFHDFSLFIFLKQRPSGTAYDEIFLEYLTNKTQRHWFLVAAKLACVIQSRPSELGGAAASIRARFIGGCNVIQYGSGRRYTAK